MSKLLGKLLTRSFPGKPAEAFPVLNPSSPDPQDEQHQALDNARGYESRAFALWLEELTKLGGERLVDFGPLQPQSVAFFCEQHMGVSIAGLDVQSDLNCQLASFNGEQQYDAALCWEFPNYLDPIGMRQLGQWLSTHIKPHGLAMLSLAINTPYPDQPAVYRIVDNYHLERDPAPVGEGRQQRFSSGELSKYWPDFSPIRSFLLRSGMQEYVLRRRSAS